MARALLTAARYEAGTWRSLARWVSRRPDVPPGATPFAYRSPLLPPIIVILAVSVVEVVVLDLVVPWPALRIALLVIGIWGVAQGLGMLASVTSYPHVVAPSGLRVRYGTSLDVHVPWDAVAAARRQIGSRGGRSIQVDGDTLYALVGGQFTVVVTLARPIAVTLSGGRRAEVTALRFHADDPDLVTTIRDHLKP